MNDRNRAYDPDEYFGRASPRERPDLKAEALERLNSAAAYARLHAPELLALTDAHRVEVVREIVEFEYRTGGSMFEYERQAKKRMGR